MGQIAGMPGHASPPSVGLSCKAEEGKVGCWASFKVECRHIRTQVHTHTHTHTQTAYKDIY